MKEEKHIEVKKGDFENLHFEVKVEVTGEKVEHDKWECKICQATRASALAEEAIKCHEHCEKAREEARQDTLKEIAAAILDYPLK